MDKELYKSKIIFSEVYKENVSPEWTFPEYICPICVSEKSKLVLVKNSFDQSDTTAWQMERLSFDDYVHEYNFSFSLICQDCGETVYCMGYGEGEVHSWSHADPNKQEENYQEFEAKYTPLFFVPNLKMFLIPNDTPKTVKDLLNDSFRLFFANPYASANQIRRATEMLLTEQGVKRTSISKPKNKLHQCIEEIKKQNKNPKFEKLLIELSNELDQKTDVVKKGKRVDLSLHQRIEIFRKKNQNLELEEVLKALKNLGNAGSHTSKELTHDDVLDSYEFMEYVLNFLYVKTESLVSKAKKI